MAALDGNGDFTRPAWLSSKIGAEVTSAAVESMSAAGGLSADMQRLRVRLVDGSERTYVLKQTKGSDASLSQSKSMGLVREALFYEFILKQGDGVWSRIPVPQVVHAEGDMDKGAKVILMEDLSEATQSGLMFGPGSPLNWGKDLDSLTARCRASGLDVKAVTTLAFEAAATLHAPYWNSTSELAKHSWLRGAGWLQGEGEQAWRGYQAHAAGAWARAKDKMKKTSSSDGEAAAVTWDPFVVSCVDNAVEAASSEGSWASFRASMASFALTLTHGDFHPANMMIVLSPGPEGGDPAGKGASGGPDPTAPASPPPGGGLGAAAAGGSGASIVLLDFEQVGVGSGPQDLGQYLISHASPEDRRALEAQGILRVYYDKLCSLNPAVPATLTFEQCEAEYVQGGAGRWLWFLPVLDSMCPPKMTQYFHDQTAAFMKDHGITPETVPLPRV